MKKESFLIIKIIFILSIYVVVFSKIFINGQSHILMSYQMVFYINILYFFINYNSSVLKVRDIFSGQFRPNRGIVYCIVSILPILSNFGNQLNPALYRSGLFYFLLASSLSIFNFGLKETRE